MRDSAMKEAVRLAGLKTKDGEPTGPAATVAAKAVEVGFLSPSRLRTELEAAGYKITTKPGAPKRLEGEKPGVWLTVTGEESVVVARAYSGDADDALLQAVFSWLKEEAKAAKIPEYA